jgi:O-antigen ligase/polysaccharide polymerase Wzy-like membrane protein
MSPPSPGLRAPSYRWKQSADGLDYVMLACLCIGSVALVLFDWIALFGFAGSIISQATRALLLAMFVGYIAFTSVSRGGHGFRFAGVLGYFAAISLVYTALSTDPVGDFYSVMRMIYWVLGSVVAHRLFLCGAMSETVLRRTIMATVMIGAAFTVFLMSLPQIEAGQNANAYLLLWCLPLLLLTKRTMLANLCIVVAVAAILLTVKRGAVVALGFSLVAYGLSYASLHVNFRALSRLAAFLIVIASVGVYTLSHHWEDVSTRFADMTGSDRARLYVMLFDHWRESDPINLFCGFGINSVQQYTGLVYHNDATRSGIYAHSDWLQYVHDFGLLGIVFMAWLHIRFLLLIRESYRMHHRYTPSLIMGYVILFLVNIYSGQLMGPNAIYLGLLLAAGSSATQLDALNSRITMRGTVLVRKTRLM